MVDFIKLYWKDKSRFEDFVCREENFENLYSVLEQHSGEITYPYRTKLDCMDVVVNDQTGYVKNSLHKLHNWRAEYNDHNYNDFTYSQVSNTIDYLSNRLTDTEGAHLTQLEFGLNINVDKPAEEIIQGNILMHKHKGFNHNRRYHGKGQLKQFDHSTYVIKVYDKAKQYGIKDRNILRFEIKFIRTKDFQKIGIHQIEDLKSRDKLSNLFGLLIKRFDELTIVDEFPDDLNKSDKDYMAFLQYINPRFWEEDLKGKHPETKARHRKKFDRLLNEYDLLKTKNALREQLIQKFQFLINN